MKAPKFRCRPLALVVLMAMVVLAAFLLLGPRRPPSLQPIVVFPDSYSFPQQPVSLFAKLVPPTPAWAWLWHLKEAVCGKIKPIDIHADLITVPQSFTPALGRPQFDGLGSLHDSALRVWFLPADELNALRRQLKSLQGINFINSPRIITGDGIGASLFVGGTIVLNGMTNETGVRAGFFTRVRPELLDLSASFLFSEVVTNELSIPVFQTNLDVIARFQITNGIGIFLLQSFPQQTNRSPMAVILSTKK